jgi:carbon-monoxide dehydrogenase medium subunit
MKPPPFRFHRAATLGDAVQCLADSGEEAKVLAGGQSLIPLMNLRLVRADTLIDIAPVTEIQGISLDHSTSPTLRIGGGTRHQEIARSSSIRERLPIVAQAASWIGHSSIRARGTIGGSLAHADPLAEHSLVALALGARVVVHSVRGTRTVPIDQFVQSVFTTALEPDEIITEVGYPLIPSGWGWGLSEHARRPGDFAIAGAVVLLELAEGRVSAASATYMGGPEGPCPLTEQTMMLVGLSLNPGVIREWAQTTAAEVSVMSDSAFSARARRRVLAAVLDEALTQACDRARPESIHRDAS